MELIRFDQFADARHISSSHQRDNALGLRTELSDAIGKIDEALLFGERVMWFSGRMSYILDQQAELTSYRILSHPGVQETLDGVGSINMLEKIAAEREATLNRIFQRLQMERLQVTNVALNLINQVFLRAALLLAEIFSLVILASWLWHRPSRRKSA